MEDDALSRQLWDAAGVPASPNGLAKIAERASYLRRRRRRVGLGVSAAVAVLAAGAVATNPLGSDEAQRFGDAPVWFDQQGATGARMTGWLSSTPGEFIVDVDGAVLVGSTTDRSVAPYNGAGMAGVEPLVVTGAANFRLPGGDSAAVVSASIGQEVRELRAIPHFDGGVDVLSTVTEDEAGRRLAVVSLVRSQAYNDEEDLLIELAAIDQRGAEVATVYIRPFPLRDVRCGNVTQIATPDGQPDGQRTAEPDIGDSQDQRATVIALRPACPSDVAQ